MVVAVGLVGGIGWSGRGRQRAAWIVVGVGASVGCKGCSSEGVSVAYCRLVRRIRDIADGGCVGSFVGAMVGSVYTKSVLWNCSALMCMGGTVDGITSGCDRGVAVGSLSVWCCLNSDGVSWAYRRLVCIGAGRIAVDGIRTVGIG